MPCVQRGPCPIDLVPCDISMISQPQGRLRLAVQTTSWEPDAGAWERLLSLLPTEDAAACTRFRQREDQKRALVSRLLQRAAAASAGITRFEAATSAAAPSSPPPAFARTRGNKPYLAVPSTRPPHAPHWNYSVSHEVRRAEKAGRQEGAR